MMKDAAESMDVAPMTIVSGSHIQNAETDGSTLFYNEEFMSSLAVSAGEDGVRFVVAHELGHQLHGMGNSGHEAEYMADEYAAKHLAQIGGDVEAISGVMTYLHILSPDANETHPAPSSRAARANNVFRKERANVAEDVSMDLDTKNPNVKDLAI